MANRQIEIQVVGLEDIKALTAEMKKNKGAVDALVPSLGSASKAFDTLSVSADKAVKSLGDFTIAARTAGVQLSALSSLTQTANQSTRNYANTTAQASTSLKAYSQSATSASTSLSALGGNTRAAVTSVNSLSSALVQGKAHGDNFFTSFLRYQLLSRVFGEVTRAIGETIQATIELDKQSARVARVTGHGDRQYAAASIAADSATSGLDYKTVGEGYYQLATQMGNVREASGAMQTAMNLVVGTESDMTGTTRALSQIYYEFSGSLDQASGKVENFRRIGDAIAITYKLTNTEVNELTQSLKYLAPIAAAAHVAPEQVFAMVGALDKAGIRGSMAGTGSAQFISNLISKYDDSLGGVAKGKNLATFTRERNAQGGLDIIKTLQNIISVAERLGRTDTSKAEKFLQTVSGSERSFRFTGAIAALKEAMNDILGLEKKVGESLHTGGTRYAEELAKEMKDTFSNKIATAWESTLSVMSIKWSQFSKTLGLSQLLGDIALVNQEFLSFEKQKQEANSFVNNLSGRQSAAAGSVYLGSYLANRVGAITEGVHTYQDMEDAGVPPAIIDKVMAKAKVKGAYTAPSGFGPFWKGSSVTAQGMADILKEFQREERIKPSLPPTSALATPRPPAMGGLGTKPDKNAGNKAERLAEDMARQKQSDYFEWLRATKGEDALEEARIRANYNEAKTRSPRLARETFEADMKALRERRTEKQQIEVEENAQERQSRANRSYEIRRKMSDGGEVTDAFDEMRTGLQEKGLSFADRVNLVKIWQNKKTAIGVAKIYEQMGENPFNTADNWSDITANYRMSAYDSRIRGLDLGYRGNALTATQGGELALLEQKRTVAQEALAQEALAQETRGTENFKRFTEALENANKAIVDFKDNLEKQAYQRGIAAIGERRNDALFELEMSQGVVGSSGAFGQSLSAAHARVGIYRKEMAERAMAFVFSPESERESNANLFKESVKDFRRASKELADLPLQRYIQTRDSVAQTLNGGIVNWLRGNGSLGGAVRGVGDMVVNKALEGMVEKWTNPLVTSVTNQITALDANTAALTALPLQMQSVMTGSGSAGGGISAGNGIPSLVAAGVAAGVTGAFGGADGKGGTPPKLSAKHGASYQNGLGQAAGAYSLFAQGQENGVTAGGLLGAGMAGSQLFKGLGAWGAIAGIGLDLLGSLFHKKKQDPMENTRNWHFGTQNAPDRFFYEAYRFRVTGQMPTAAQLGLTTTNYQPPTVIINIDGRKAMDSQITKSIRGASTTYTTQNLLNVP